MEQSVQCCLPSFPNPASRSKNSRSPASVPVSLPDYDLDLLKSTYTTAAAVDALLIKAWALVLRCYIGSDEVSLGYQKERFGEDEPLQSHLVAIRISDEDQLPELRKRELTTTRSEADQFDFTSFNTVFLRKMEKEDSDSSSDTIPEGCRIRFCIEDYFGRPSLSLEYWRDEVASGHVTCMAQVLSQIITQLLTIDERPVKDLDFFTPQDSRRVAKWNTSMPATRDSCIHEIVQKQCRKWPVKEAICAWDGTFTFSEFDSVTSRFASYLQSQGVGPETMVPLCFEKTKWYTIAVYSVLKAGGAFVPLDPSHPESRLRSLIDKVGAKIVLTSSEQQSKLALATTLPVVAIDDDLLSRCVNSTFEELVTPSNAAYIIFTSGSTGEPKGTVVEHRAFSSSSLAHTDPLRLTSDCRCLQFAAHTFDASLVDILSGLMNGATVCVPSEDARINDLAGAINNLRVNYIGLTPSVVEFLTPAMVPNVHTVCLAGEAMAVHQRDMWCSLNLVNGFGPTETSITSAGNPNVTRETDVKDIGLPVGGRCWIVDPHDHHRMMPVGAVGEMLVEGPSLARGYLNNPEKTQEAFIYAPSWATDTNEAGEKRRFYKSGDLVRYNSALGALTYIGRKDTQVKLHGQRVELGEIESRLTADVDIQLSMVHVPRAGYAKGKLVTVFCFAGANHTDNRELLLDDASKQRMAGLRQRIETILPTYMVPGIWLSVESLPFLPSGKLDRKKVAKWVEDLEEDPQFALGADEETDKTIFTPANETEQLLAEAWSRVLNIPRGRLRLTENFLKLGGDSLTAMTCTSLCKKAGIGLTVQDILRRHSIRDLAMHTSAIQSPTFYEEKIEEKFDLSPIQHLHSLVRHEGQGYFNQSIQTRVSQRITASALRDAIGALVARHSMLRARFSHDGPEKKMRQRITEEVTSSYRLNCPTVENDSDVDGVISISQQSINCFVGPLLSVDLIDTPGKGQLLSLVGHHLVVDIVSFRLILEDLEELLLEPGKTVASFSSMPYQMWSAKQTEQAELDTAASTELISAPPHNFDFWGVDNTIMYGDVQCSTFEVSQESTSLLLTGCHESLNTETVDLLLACMLHSFAQAFPGGPTPAINNEGHGREPWDNSVDISRTVGWFTTLYPIWAPGITANQDILQTVAHVKDMRRRAAENGRAFFAHRILTAAGREKFPHPVPMEMSFNYLGQNRDLQNQKGLFHLADTMVGETREGGGAADFGRDTPRFALFEISAAVIEGQLRFTFSYGKSIKHQDQVKTWLKNCQALLEQLPTQLLAAPPTKTASDFPMLKLNSDLLQTIESGIMPRYGITSLNAVEDMFPCTRMQQGILLSRCRNPLLYAVHTTFEVCGLGSGATATQAILAAWSKLISHHSMLRTIFVDKLTPNAPFGQVVLKDIGYAEPAQLSCEDEEQVIATFASRDIVPYHDSHRFSVCTANNSGKVFCRLEMNHAAMDGASISILLRDLKEACTESFPTGPKAEFKEFAQYIQQPTSSDAMEFWTSYLGGARPCHIPLNPKGNDLANRTAIRTSRIEFNDFSRLHKFCETAGITHSTVFNVAWGLLLSFLTQSEDVSFAYTTSLRDAPVEGVDGMIGPVMNLNVCRIKLPSADSRTTLFDVLHKTQDDFTESLPHRACSLIDVMHELKMANTSLFNSGVSYRKLPPPSEAAGKDSVAFVQKGYIHDPAETAVYVNVEAAEDSATIELNHWIECLSEAQADLIAKLYVEKIEDVIRDSEKQQIVGMLRQMGDEEKSMFEDQDTAPWEQAVASTEPCLLPSIVDSEYAEGEAGVHAITQLTVQQPAKLLQFCKENDFDAALVYQFVWAVVLRLYSGVPQTCFGVLDTSRPNHRLENRSVNADDTTSILQALQQLKVDSANRSTPWISATKVMEPTAGQEIPFNTVVCAQSGEEATSTATINRLLSGGSFSAVLLNPGPLTRRLGNVKLYHSKKLSKDYVEGITDCFLHVLAQVPAKALRSVGDLDFIDDKTCARFQQISAPLPPTDSRCAHDIILERAITHPYAPAVSAWDGSLDYSELLTLTTQLAQKMRHMGVGPNVFVACVFDKSMWAVVAQLAVMQAGGAFCSLDPTHAEERLRTLVGQLQAPLVLCSASRLDIASRISEVAIAIENEEYDVVAPAALPPAEVETVATDPAYAVFTSGTTGTPKASVIEHTALTVSAAGWKDIVGFNEHSRVFQFSAFTFDVSVMDVFFTLLNGGCICMPSESDRMNDLAGAINRSGATLMAQVPSLFATIDPATVPTLQYLIPGGEKMSPTFLQQWKSRHVVNAYGPSETTVMATVSLKSDGNGELLNTDGTDIGVPACGRAWITDADNVDKLLPRGAVGELVIEGPNVGRGYLNNEEKTNHAFIRNPQWTSDPRLQPIFRQGPTGQSERMYRTGDLARLAPNGSLTFLTRNDTQVKLKGQRVELEEIEYHSSILAAKDVLVDIVTPKENTMAAGLAAFFVSDIEDGEPADGVLLPMTPARSSLVESLREGLPRHVPLYMVPTFYFPVRYLPRSASSKLDRRALQTMAASMTKGEMRQYTSTSSNTSDIPKTGLEPVVRGLWEKVMSLTPGSVTDDDSFFGLGGDSFAAMTLVSAAQASGLSLTVADVFTHPTLVDMCTAIQSNDPKETVAATVVEPFSLIPADASREEVLADASDVCNISVEAIEDVYPCSPLQSGLITSSTAKPGAFVVRSTYRLADSIDLDQFKAAWQQTVNDLPILRTRIVHTADAGFCQVVLRESTIQWNNASEVPKQSDNVPSLPNSEGDVLTDYTIVDTGSERFFAWSLHHAAYDGWSIGLMLQTVQDHYKGIVAAAQQPTPYSVFIDYLAKSDSAASDEFWKTALADFKTPAFPRIKDTARPINAGSRQYINMDLPTITNTDVTLPVMVRGAWAITVADQSEASDVCFGETLMARNINLPGVTTMAGPVLTTMPTRVQVDKQNTVSSYLQRINQQMIDVIPHQHAGLQRVRRLATSTSAACDFQNLLVVQAEDQDLEKSVWKFEDIQAGDDFFTHPLVVECKISGTQIKITAHHDDQVITASQVNSLVARFNFILKQLVELPRGSDLTLGHIDLVSPADKQQILAWNGDRIAPIEKTIHDLVYEQGSLQPNAEAICAWDGTLTYREMCDHAAVFAHYLLSLGLHKEMFVPVCMDKSAWMVVAILGVLAAGGAYVPLDPAHPASRHEEIIADVGAEFVICLPKYSNRYAKMVKTVLAIDRSVFDSMKTSSERPLHRSASTNMAYALFTSGSTGKPKGIVTEHASFVTSVSAFGPVVHLDRGTRAFHFASLTFDAAVMEIWGTLIFGGCVCIPSEEDRLNDVAGAMNAMGIHWTFCTPSVASIIEPTSVPSLKTLVCGGEMISAEVINKWTPYVEVINGYGPTETSVFATLAKISPKSEPACIGHGIQSTCTWVVDPDDHDRLTPVGSVGELALSGRALAREYLNNPAKTNAEFINNPRWASSFPTTTADRIYKTGDLVRYYPNGAIECLGRKDHQVKLHGQRMELGEIESRLSQMDSIRHAIVLLPKTGLIKKRLVAILAVNAGDKSLASTNDCQLVDPSVMHAAKLPEVQASLEKQLPIYMVPQAWVVMEHLPMLVSGKIDRKQITAWIENLDKPNYERIMKDYDDIKRGKVPVPETKQQGSAVSAVDILRDVSAQVLNLPVSSLDSQRSFLSLGGDSITGMAVVSKARKQGLTVRLQDIIQTDSIHALAERSTLTDTSKKQPTGRSRANSGAAFSLSPIQNLYFQHAANGHKGTSRFNQSITVRLARRVDSAKVQEALKTIVLRHGMLRARFNKDSDGTWKQRTTRDIESSYALRIHATSDREHIKSQMGKSQRAPDPEHGPIVVADFFEAPGKDQVLFLVANHLCIDMVSWRVVLQELEEYLHTGAIASEVPLSFQAWCGSQSPGEKDTQTLQIPEGLSNADYWGVGGFENTYGQVKTQGFSLDESSTNMLLDGLQTSAQTEPLDLLLAVAFQSFSQVFPDLAYPTIYNESHGRQSTTQDVSETVGWFTSVMPLQVKRSTNIMDTIKQVKDQRKQNNSTDISRRRGPMEILFNYLGKLQQLERSDSLFQHYSEVFAEGELTDYGDMGSRTARFALFELSAIVIKDKLRIAFTFNKNLKHQDKIAEWISSFEAILRDALPGFRKMADEITPESYPLLPASSKELKQLVERTLPSMGVTSMANVENMYPVAPVQEGILLSQLRDPSNYMFHAIFKINENKSGSAVDTKLLAAAWQRVVNRHPILRTIFVESNYKNGTFDQVVLKKVDATPTTIACNDDRSAPKHLSTIRLSDVNKQKSPQIPHHVTICRVISTGEVYVKMEMNHALIDGASISIILRDFSAAYGNQLTPTLPGPDYSQFVKYLQGRTDMSGLQYWAHHLRHLHTTHIPVAQNLTKTRRLGSLKVAFHRFDELQALCKRESITFASLALASWATVLSALTGQDDVCFGYLSAGRDVPVNDIQDAVGVFINMLCCRVKLSSRQDYGSLFRQVQSDFLEGLPHQATSLAEIQNHIGMEGQMMFNSTLSIQNQMPTDASQAETLSFSAKEVHDPSEYPMTVNVITAKDNEGIMLRYWSDKISDSRAHAIAAAITQTFENALQDDKESGISTPGVQTPIPGTPMLMPDLSSAPPTPQLRGLLTPPHSVDAFDPKSLHSLIDERVHAVMSQMLGNSGSSKAPVPASLLTPPRSTAPTMITPPRSEENLPGSLAGLAIRNSQALALDEPNKDLSSTVVYEPKLLSIWSTILEVPIDTIGREDSFFRLGGDSIKAMKLASAAREQEMALRVSDIFQSPVFIDMLKLITANSDAPKAPVAPKPTTAPLIKTPPKEEPEKTLAPVTRPRAKSAYETMQLDSQFLQKSICPQIGTFKGAVADVLPVTDFQAFSLTAQEFQSRWMLNYFYFEGNGPLDVRRLREACKRVLDTFDILRSVFVCAEGQFYQVVLKKMKVDLAVHDTEMELDDFVASLQQKDRDQPPKHGEPFVKFAVARKSGTNLHRILVRMSHAQYDGVCLWKLLDAIKQGYEGGTLPKTSSFASHMRLMSSNVSEDHYEHFTNLLKGSKMPEIIRRNGPNTYCHVGSSTNVNKTIDISMGSKGSITIATVVQAAWAVTLAKISAQPDVVFGLTINGRNASVPGIETAVGPCVNMIPVRVAFGDSWNGLDLLRLIQDQSVANMPYENLGFREIIHRCTDWENSSYFSTSVFHQNVHYEGNITLDEEAYRIGGAGVVDNLSDLTFVSTPLAQEGKYHISLHYSEKGPIDAAFANRVLNMAIEAINSLTTSPGATLPSPTTLTSLPAQQIEEPPRPSDGDFLGERLKGAKIDSLLIHSPALTHAWKQVLGSSEKDNDNSASQNVGFELHSTFFELGGDLLALGKVVYMLHQDEYNVTLEDLLEHPTFLGQLAVLALKNEDAVADGEETEAEDAAGNRSSRISTRGVRRHSRRQSRHNRRTSAGVEDSAPPMPGPRENQLLQEELKKNNDSPLASKRSSKRWSRLSFSRRSSIGTMDGERPPMPGPQENQMLQDELNKRALDSGNVAAGVKDSESPAIPKRSSRRWTLSRSRRNSNAAEADTALPPMPGPLEHQMLQDQLNKHARAQRDTMESPSGSEVTRQSEKTDATGKSGSRGLWKSMGMSRNKTKKSGLQEQTA